MYEFPSSLLIQSRKLLQNLLDETLNPTRPYILQSHTESFVFEAGDANLGHVAATDYKDAQSRISVLQGKLAYFRHHPVTSRASLKPLRKRKKCFFLHSSKDFLFSSPHVSVAHRDKEN